MPGSRGTISWPVIRKCLAMIENYENFLQKAYSEGWRDPIEVTNLEIKAYTAGMLTERKRVLSILSGIDDGRPMRAIDLARYINKIKKIKK
jgi:hypothetical protein